MIAAPATTRASDGFNTTLETLTFFLCELCSLFFSL